MKLKEFMEANNLKDEEELREFFRLNTLRGSGPVAIAACPKCGEIVSDYSKEHTCQDLKAAPA